MSRYRNTGDDRQLQRDKDRLFAGRDGGAAPAASRGSRGRYGGRDSGYDSGSSGYDSGYGDGGRGRYGSARYDDRRQNGVTAENATEEDVDYVRSQIKNTKMQTLQSSRNALRMVMDAESNATRTMDQLGSQSEALSRMEHRMDVTQIHADIAADKSAQLKDLNRSMFRPVFKNPFASKKRGEAKLAKAQEDRLAAQELRSQGAEPKGRGMEGGAAAGGDHYRSRRDYSPSSYGRYQFEADEADHEVERELASNLDNVSEAAARLKSMALSMNGEIQNQNVAITRLSEKVDKTGATIASNSSRLRSIK